MQVRQLMGVIAGAFISALAWGEDPEVRDAYFPDMPVAHVSEAAGEDVYEFVGEGYDPFTGRLSFIQTDIELPGNFALPVRVRRTKNSFLQGREMAADLAIFPVSFGDWYLDIPFLTVVNHSGSSGRSEFYSFCLDPKRTTSITDSYDHPVPTLRVNSESKILKLIAPHNASLYPAGATFVTDDHWIAYCHEINTNNMGLRVVSPEGDTYLFDSVAPDYRGIYASSVTDRNGNWVRYNQLFGEQGEIVASDGRRIVLHRDINTGLITSVSDGENTWTYTYQQTEHASYLTEVILPSAEKVTFQIETLISRLTVRYWHNNLGKKLFYTITSPYGAAYKYDLVADFECSGLAGTPDQVSHAETCTDTVFYVSLEKKAVSFPSGQGYSTSFNYTSDATTRTTTINSSESRKRFVYSQDYNWGSTTWDPAFEITKEHLYGSLISLSTYWPDSEDLYEKVVFQYEYKIRGNVPCTPTAAAVSGPPPAPPSITFQPFACSDGNLVNPGLVAAKIAAAQARMTKRTLEFKDDQYYEETLSFDAYENPKKILSHNSFSPDKKYMWRKYINSIADKYVVGLLAENLISEDGALWLSSEKNEYDANYNLVSVTEFGAQLWTVTERRADGLPQKVEYPLPDRWISFGSYTAGVASVVNYPSRYDTSQATSYTKSINQLGRATLVRLPSGVEQYFEYDFEGKLRKIDFQNPVWADYVIEYLPVTEVDASLYPSLIALGQKKRVTTAANYRNVEYFDGAGRVVLESEEDTSGNAPPVYKVRKLTASGQVSYESYPSASPTEQLGVQYTLDPLGHKVGTTLLPGGQSSSSLFLASNKREFTDFNGFKTVVRFRAFGSRDYSLATAILESTGAATSIDYDVIGKARSVVKGGQSHIYVYDAFQRLCKIYRPESSWEYFDYNLAGELVWVARGIEAASDTCDRDTVPDERKVVMVRDNLGGVHRKVFGDGGSDVLLEYDLDGNLVMTQRGNARWTYSYNDRGSLATETLATGDKTFSLSRQFDEIGYEKSLTYPSGKTISFTPNALGQVISISGIASEIGYFPGSSISFLQFSNGVRLELTEESRKLPRTLEISSPYGVVASYHYDYDSNGNLNTIVDNRDASRTVTLGYDSRNRLTTSQGAWGIFSFSYDHLDNITSRDENGDVDTYYYDARNRLESVVGSRGMALTYNAEGSVSHDGSRQFSYTLDGAVSSIGLDTFLYDANGMRTVRSDETGESYFVYDSTGRLLHSVSPLGLRTDYIYVLGRLVARLESR